MSIMSSSNACYYVLQVGGSITGRYSKTLMARERGSNLAIAISADGTIMAISTDFSDRIHFAIALYSLPDGVLLLECGERGGGPTQLGSPHMLCFSPRDNNLLICDSENGRVQVQRFPFVSLLGTLHMRSPENSLFLSSLLRSLLPRVATYERLGKASYVNVPMASLQVLM